MPLETGHPNSPPLRPILVFALILFFVLVSHLPLLRLPYFWDEAGYYVPAARDLLLTGSWIPHSVPSNAHPPVVMAYLALWWRVAGYSPLLTRAAMLLVASFSLLGLFRLGLKVANIEVAVASTLCTALYPVFFAQSSLAQVDLAAAGLTFWALGDYVEDRPTAASIWFSLAGLAKETAILAPLALLGWGLICPRLHAEIAGEPLCLPTRRITKLALLFPLAPLAAWYTYHYLRTGYVFGNPEFFRYNVQATLSLLRMIIALALRSWQVLGYFDLYLLTIAAALAMCLPARQDAGGERLRIRISVQFAFLAVITAYVVAMALIGGAVLARYMLPAVPLAIVIFISTLWRRVRFWRAIVGIVLLAFVVNLFVNPPYGFSIEDNLAYRHYVVMHEQAEQFLEQRYPRARVLTAWPATDELTRPYLGYVDRPMRVVRLEDFSLTHIISAATERSKYDVALVFSTKYQPAHPLLDRWAAWERLKTRFFGFHRDLPPESIVQILGGRIVFVEKVQGQWIAVMEIETPLEARLAVQHDLWPTPVDPGTGTPPGLTSLDHIASKWQEWVLMTSQTSPPRASCSASRAARVR